MDDETPGPLEPEPTAPRTTVRRAPIVVAALAAVAAATLVGVLTLRGSSPPAASGRETAERLPGALAAPAPWPPNGEALEARLELLGLPRMPTEGATLHLHVVLQIRIDGRLVPIPAGIGLDPERRFLAPIHTHDASGTIHVESDEVRTFRLGEVFDVWGLPVNERCLGPYCAGGGATLVFTVDGEPIAGDPRDVDLRDGQAIGVQYSSA